jgi:hypothetical protein
VIQRSKTWKVIGLGLKKKDDWSQFTARTYGIRRNVVNILTISGLRALNIPILIRAAASTSIKPGRVKRKIREDWFTLLFRGHTSSTTVLNLLRSNDNIRIVRVSFFELMIEAPFGMTS